MKNMVISILLILLLNMQSGWIAKGVGRFLLSLILILLIDVMITDIERAIKYGSRYK